MYSIILIIVHRSLYSLDGSGSMQMSMAARYVGSSSGETHPVNSTYFSMSRCPGQLLELGEHVAPTDHVAQDVGAAEVEDEVLDGSQ